MNIKQRTITTAITFVGVGLHSGKEVTLSLLPAEVGHGLVFERTDIDNGKLSNGKKEQSHPRIPATAELITDTMMSSNLIKDGIKVGTVEHLLSAVSAMGIDNLLIQVSDQEIPIMDGSALQFIDFIEQAGVVEQTEDRAFLKVTRPIRVEVDDKWVELLPASERQTTGFEMTFEIKFDHPAIASTPQKAHLEFSKENFIREISKARTFGFEKDIEYLRKNGLALGGSLDNAIVLGEDSIVNQEGLRFADEFVRHKILDAIGDLYLIGYPLLGRYNAYKSGHSLNNTLIREVLSDKNNYEIVTIDYNDIPFIN